MVVVDASDLTIDAAFAIFADQDSGCLSYGVESGGDRWFVKTATTPDARASLTRSACLHAAVRHDAIVRPAHVFDGLDGVTLVYPWYDGSVLNAATYDGPDRSALYRFQGLPLAAVRDAADTVLDAHLAVAAAGWVPVDLYDGCFLYDFDRHRMRLVDLDEYRPGPFTLHSDRLPGSARYMAPEESVPGSRIDERTGVYVLGRTLWHLLDTPSGHRATPAQRDVIDTATRPAPGDRHGTIAELVRAFRGA
jgi:serine/threonine-protein kinase